MILGIDIGGTKIAGGVVTAEGQVIRRAQVPTPAQAGAPAVRDAAIALARSLQTPDVRAVGIGAGGQIDPKSGIVRSATEILPGWTGIDLKATFEAALGIPAFAENDVNALALGEAQFGAAKGQETVVFLALGTGVGGALLLDGRLHHGAHCTGGEFGHLLLDISPDARLDSGGHRGTLEAYVSGPGLLATWRELSRDRRPDVQGTDVPALPFGPDAVAKTGEFLGLGLVSLANCLDPDRIVIGGGLAALGDALLGPARQVLTARALPGPAQCPVVPASLGADASIIGAASVAIPCLA